jgi:polysaccharide biosynthesis PFTS motif protein
MIWYSANAVPINYRDKNLVRTHFNEKNFDFMPLDLHYVWNQSHKDYLDSVIDPPMPVEVCGSLMFYLPQEEIAVAKVYDIVIFDVTPYEPTFKDGFDKIPFSQSSIYNESTATEFLQDLLWAKHEIEERFGVNLVLALKPKRKYTPLHSRGYLAFLDHLSKNGLITILTPEIDLYKTIGESKMSISYPFTSPAIIAMELNIPTAYFLANKSIESNALIDGIEFITDRTKLLDFIIKHRIMER